MTVKRTARGPFSAPLGIVPALDVDSLSHLERVVTSTTRVEGVAGYKLGLTVVLRLGLAGAVERLRQMTDRPILYDHQKAGPDMPDMAAKFAALCAEARVDGLILFPTAGPTAVDGFVGQSLRAGLIPVVGGEIPVPDYGASGGGFMLDDALDRLLDRAVAAGARHFVLPANDPAKIERRTAWLREHARDPVVFLTGFGSLGGRIEDAFAAARACQRRYAIVGRLITASPDPAEAARRLFDEMAAVV